MNQNQKNTIAYIDWIISVLEKFKPVLAEYNKNQEDILLPETFNFSHADETADYLKDKDGNWNEHPVLYFAEHFGESITEGGWNLITNRIRHEPEEINFECDEDPEEMDEDGLKNKDKELWFDWLLTFPDGDESEPTVADFYASE